ncbi:MAG: prepilin-type N-terminal cleavage/methylation domain-containing protein [bacterium]
MHSVRGTAGNGFSIIEILVVAAVILILAAAFIPRFTRDAIVQKKVYTAAHNIASDIRYARRLAVGGGTTGNAGLDYYTYFTTAGASTDTVELYETGAGNPEKSTLVGDDDVQLEMLESLLTDSIYFSATGQPYYAPAPGFASTPTGFTIEVKDSGDRWIWRVSVERNTGRAFLTEIQ